MNLSLSFLKRALPLLSVAVLYGCGTHPPAPVVDRAGSAVSVKPASATGGVGSAASASGGGYYTVKKGDTLYSIALDNGQDYKDVAAWNNLENPNVIKIGQQLRVSGAEGGAPVAVSKPISSSSPVEVKPAGAAAKNVNTDVLKREPKGGKTEFSEEALARARQGDAAAPAPTPAAADAKPKPAEKVAAADDVEWNWPANGKLLTTFAEGSSKGLDIGGKAGDPVFAAATGVVSYAGSGLRGYGNLVVLRHNASYLSVYAHNSKILVKEKQAVTQGQKIAEIGSSDAESPRLHFEIRRQGKPADPQKYLPAR
jgi:lipoprotein NlpD